MEKPIIPKIWINCMDHFCQAHQELRSIDTTINRLSYDSINTIVEQIVDCLRIQQGVENKAVNAPPGFYPPEIVQPPHFDLSVIPQPLLQANVVINPDVACMEERM